MMSIRFFCPRWGQAHLPWDTFARQVKAAGYDGVETDLPEDPSDASAMLDTLDKYGLLFIAQHWETIDPDFETHLAQYVKRITRLAAVKPLLINAQTGRDFFTAEQNDRLLAEAAAISADTGIPLYHETHRGKFSFAAHITEGFLQRNPDLRLTLDLSHWINVAETWLFDQPQAIALAIERTGHLHARVGHTQGPQVPDPRAAEWQEALQIHLAYWDQVVNIRRQKGDALLTITPEFGPSPYMPLLPYKATPLADQWELNIFMMQTLKDRYKNYTTGS